MREGGGPGRTVTDTPGSSRRSPGSGKVGQFDLVAEASAARVGPLLADLVTRGTT